MTKTIEQLQAQLQNIVATLDTKVELLTQSAEEAVQAGQAEKAIFIDGKVAGLREAKAILKGLLK